MIANTFMKGFAVCCCLVGVVCFLFGAYFLWTAPIEQGKDGVMLLAGGFVLHTIFWILWP